MSQEKPNDDMTLIHRHAPEECRGLPDQFPVDAHVARIRDRWALTSEVLGRLGDHELRRTSMDHGATCRPCGVQLIACTRTRCPEPHHAVWCWVFELTAGLCKSVASRYPDSTQMDFQDLHHETAMKLMHGLVSWKSFDPDTMFLRMVEREFSLVQGVMSRANWDVKSIAAEMTVVVSEVRDPLAVEDPHEVQVPAWGERMDVPEDVTGPLASEGERRALRRIISLTTDEFGSISPANRVLGEGFWRQLCFPEDAMTQRRMAQEAGVGQSTVSRRYREFRVLVHRAVEGSHELSDDSKVLLLSGLETLFAPSTEGGA